MQAEDPHPPPIPVEFRLSATTLPLQLPEGDTTREADASSTPPMAELGQAREGSSAMSRGFTSDDIRVQERLRLRRLILHDPRQAALELDIPISHITRGSPRSRVHAEAARRVLSRQQAQSPRRAPR
jgi:hypothetical protein